MKAWDGWCWGQDASATITHNSRVRTPRSVSQREIETEPRSLRPRSRCSLDFRRPGRTRDEEPFPTQHLQASRRTRGRPCVFGQRTQATAKVELRLKVAQFASPTPRCRASSKLVDRSPPILAQEAVRDVATFPLFAVGPRAGRRSPPDLLVRILPSVVQRLTAHPALM
jgi:hypothetical protein